MKDHYIDESGVLINKLQIKNEKLLADKEAEFTALRMIELEQNPIDGNFDMKHLQDIHKHIFQDVYEWAGEKRDIDIAKAETLFCKAEHIEYMQGVIFKDIKKDNETMSLAPGAFKDEIPEKMANHFSEINALHPFREGNGRAQKVFIGQLSEKHGITIKWENMQKNDLIEASKEGMSRAPKKLEALIKKNSEPTKKTSQSKAKKI